MNPRPIVGGLACALAAALSSGKADPQLQAALDWLTGRAACAPAGGSR